MSVPALIIEVREKGLYAVAKLRRLVSGEEDQKVRHCVAVTLDSHSTSLPDAGREARTPARRNDRSSFEAAGVLAGPAERGHPNAGTSERRAADNP